MEKMTLTQRALRPVINFLVERFFPMTAFYGWDYFNCFKEIQEEGGSLAQASTLWIVHGMHEMNAGTFEIELENVSIKGYPVGDFKITATLTKPEDTP